MRLECSSRNNLFAAALIFALVAVINIETIRTFPSWFDEAFFANISFNHSLGRGLILDLIPGYFDGEIFLYGPVYFLFQSFLIKIFGLDQLVFRLPNLLGAYFAIFLIAGVLKNFEIRRSYRYFFVLAAALDVSINRNIVSGRMDMLAVMFVALAALVVSRASFKSDWTTYSRWILVGGLSAVAYLTTPRALFLLPTLLIFGLSRIYIYSSVPIQSVRWISHALFSVIAFSIPVWMWIQQAGGLSVYASLFTGNSTASSHISPSFFRSSYDNVAIGLMLFLITFYFQEIGKKILVLGFFANYLFFSLFVKEVGPYAGMIMPFVLAIIIVILSDIQTRGHFRLLVLFAILLPGLSLMILRGMDLVVNNHCRVFDKGVFSRDNDGTRYINTIAPFKYYFLLEGSGRNLQTYEYSKVPMADLMKSADMVIASRDLVQDFSLMGFNQAIKFDCRVRRIPFLPGTFYGRSVFAEVVYSR